MKKCIKCNIDKGLEDFPKYKGRDGQLRYRNVCRDCFNRQGRESKKNDSNTDMQPQTQVKDKTIKDTDLQKDSSFTEDEIKVLKRFARERIQLDVELTDSNRIVKSFNIEESLYNVVVSYAKNLNISNSDAINKIIRCFVNNNS